MSGTDQQLTSLAHAYFRRHTRDSAARDLCTCLRPYPCSSRIWAIDYLVRNGHLVLAAS